jgi:hypothetical protein
MKLVLAAALVTALAFAGSRFSFLRLPLSRLRGPLGVRNVLLTGTEFLFVGLLLGPGLGVLDARTLLGLAPVLGMGLAWIGLLFGIQWQVRRLDEATRAGVRPAVVQAAVSGLLVGLVFYPILRHLLGADAQWALVGALTLGAAASDTAQSALALMGRTTRGEARPLARMLTLVANLDGLVAVAVVGAVCWLPVLHGGDGTVWHWAALSVGTGGLLGVTVVALTSYRLSDDEHLLVLLGTVLTGAGLALYLSLSPLFVNAVAGVVIANLAGHRPLAVLQSLLVRGDRAVYVLFLLLAGAQWQPQGATVFALALLYVVLRTAGKMAGGWAGFRGRVDDATSRSVGAGLLSHGGLAVAVVVNLQQVHDGRSAVIDVVTTLVLVGVVVSEFVSPGILRRLLSQEAPA